MKVDVIELTDKTIPTDELVICINDKGDAMVGYIHGSKQGDKYTYTCSYPYFVDVQLYNITHFIRIPKIVGHTHKKQCSCVFDGQVKYCKEYCDYRFPEKLEVQDDQP